MRNRCIVLLIGAVTLMLLVAVWRVQAAPRLPQSKTLPNEALNLGGLTEVAIEVSGKSSELRDDGVDADELTDQLRDRLVEFGFTVGDWEVLPHLVLTQLSHSNPKQPDILVIYQVISVHQSVQLYRLELDMDVPTFTVSDMAFSSANRFRKM